MRVVLDTNVLVSAVVFGGPPGQIIELAAARQLQLVLSSPLFAELRRVLRDKFAFRDEALYLTETLLRRAGVVVELSQTLAVVTEDPGDNRVLEGAVDSKADVVVSGDRHLLRLKEFQGIPIQSPRQFVREWGRKREQDR